MDSVGETSSESVSLPLSVVELEGAGGGGAVELCLDRRVLDGGGGDGVTGAGAGAPPWAVL